MFNAKPPEYKEFEDDRLLFNEESIRKAFIRKVYLILTFQMLVSLGFIVWFLFDHQVSYYVATHSWVTLGSMTAAIILLIFLLCCDLHRQYPLNIILLAAFTITESILLASISAFFGTKIVMIAAGITAVVFLSLTIFSFQTKWDFTMQGGVLLVFMVVLLMFGLLTILFPNRTMILIYSSFGALLFGVYIIYDTQLLMGGGHAMAISPEDYVVAVLTLYMDIINLFVLILNLVGGSSRN
ncbi:protein lifeguard 1-like isoform X2 [Harmonia axyridis]|nr:protein lifeguard 1-like isoform X2 [Harmonia axyridis]